MEEIWKDIIWYEGLYQISNLGNVKSLKFWKERILKSYKNSAWYLRICLFKEWKCKILRINRLVAQRFTPNPLNKTQVNHINWIKDDNKVLNLEWCNDSENQIHSYRILKRIKYLLTYLLWIRK